MKTLAIAAVFALPVPLAAQGNLVPNGSFEEYTQCPEFGSYAQYATGWFNLHTASADYYNRCQENLVVGVPYNTAGYQEASEGDGYVGLATTFPGLDSYREIVGIELSEPLQAGVPMCLSFKMALGGFGTWDGNSAMFTAKGVGLRFFNEFPADWPSYLYPNAAALSMNVVPTDTAIWYLVNGEYTPDSNYTRLAIGNFFADSLSAISDLDTTGFGAWGVSYAFIDDVRVSYDLQFCGSNGVRAFGTARSIRAYPNPFAEQLTVTLLSPAQSLLHWELLDVCGYQASMGSIGSGALMVEITLQGITPGPYLLRMYDSAGAYAPLRLVSISP